MSVVYATSSDYTAEYGGAAPANIDALLKSASRLVRQATNCDVYDVDTDGLPTDAVILAAFVEATIVQAHAWDTLDIDPATGGLVKFGSVISSKNLDGASVGYDNTPATIGPALEQRRAMVMVLVPEALAALKQAQLADSQPWSYG